MTTATRETIAEIGNRRVVKYDALGLGVWRYVVEDDKGEVIAATYGAGAEDEARLIAAAPELLAAARFAVACGTDRLLEGCDGGCLEMLADAVAKAEGSES